MAHSLPDSVWWRAEKKASGKPVDFLVWISWWICGGFLMDFSGDETIVFYMQKAGQKIHMNSAGNSHEIQFEIRHNFAKKSAGNPPDKIRREFRRKKYAEKSAVKIRREIHRGNRAKKTPHEKRHGNSPSPSAEHFGMIFLQW